MQDGRQVVSPSLEILLKLLIAALAVVVLGLPLNNLVEYAMIMVAVVVLAIGRISLDWRRWLVSALIVAAALICKTSAGVPRIEEGHNAFLPGGDNSALAKGLPADVYAFLIAEFNAAYPVERRCNPAVGGCWREEDSPKRVYAFSFDGIYDRPAYSRRVTGIAFSDALWQRLGFVNEGYNWSSSASDVQRDARVRGLDRLLHPYRIAIPYFVMYRFPADYVGSELCWRGVILWEQAAGRFEHVRNLETACRVIQAADIGKPIFGVAIRQEPPLAMELRPAFSIKLRQIFEPAFGFVAVAALLLLLLRWDTRRLRLPFVLIGMAIVVAGLHDISFIGGVRPFDGGDDGLVYDAWSREIVQHLLAGNIAAALRGGENVFHFTPGMRYLRAIEHMIFGETYLGAVSLTLLLPFLVFALFQRFFSVRTALAAALIFLAIPLGALFGSTFFLYVKWSARGYGDPAAVVFFLAGMLFLIGLTSKGPDDRFGHAIGAGLLMACALFIRPNLAVGGAILLGGAGLAALRHAQYRRVAGLTIGFAAVFVMALHNWYYGGVFVLFSGHTTLQIAQPMPPGDYLRALSELLHFNFTGEHLTRGAYQIARMLTGPSESFLMTPLHAASVVVVVWVALSRRYDGWLRLIATAALGLHLPALFYIYSGRYHLLAWLLTLLVSSVWCRDQGFVWLQRRYPKFVDSVRRQPLSIWLGEVLDWWLRATGLQSFKAI